MQKRRVNLSFQGVSAVSAGSLSGDEVRECLSELEKERGLFFSAEMSDAHSRVPDVMKDKSKT